jgi:hypothetical protein
MKTIYLFTLLLISTFSFSQDVEWIKTEGEITEITIHPGRKTRETAVIKFNLEDGTEQLGSTDLFRVPFVGSMKSVGDKISINYDKNNPFMIQTVVGSFLSNYGMYILIFLGIILSIKPFLKNRKKKTA